MEICPNPVKRAVMVQQWQDLAYIHWRYPIAEIQALLPAGVEVDSFDGSAWVGLILTHLMGQRGSGSFHSP